MYKNELYHHGIDGQKWGKRNGPPYPLDASDYSSAERKAITNKRRGLFRRKTKKVKEESVKERAKRMSDEELKASIARLKLEDEFVTAYKKVNPVKKSKGQEYIDGVKDNTVKSLTDVTSQTIKYAMVKGINKILDDDDAVHTNNKKK